MPVLLLAPTQSQAKADWAEVVRGLHLAGLRALQVADLGIDPVFAACRRPECAAQAARAAGTPVVLCERKQGMVELRWFAPEDAIWTELAELNAQGLSGAVAEAARRVLLRRALGSRALLRVASRPAGASVVVDGRLAGLTPMEEAWEPGGHTIGLQLEGFEPAQAQAQLSPGNVTEVRVELRAARSSALARRDASQRGAPSAANFVVGSALAIAALPLLIVGANSFIDDGQCLESSSGACTRRADPTARDGLMLGAGALSLAGALYLFVAQPFRLRMELSPQAAVLRVSGSF